jgi:glycosyltransferase involved in cell wall biosynthesis
MTTPARPKVVLLRGHSVNPWDLRPWELLADRFDISVLLTPSNEFNTEGLNLSLVPIASVRDRFPDNRLGRALGYAVGDGYRGLEQALAGADIVHATEIHSWFTAQAAGLRGRLGFKLVATVWETIPFMDAYRWRWERRYRRRSLPAVDLFLAASERARRTLLLEGVEAARLRVVYPGIDTERFTAGGGPLASTGDHTAAEHVILSPGRLVWEKGHQDVLRAVAALHRGLLGPAPPLRLVLVGVGPEQKRLRRHARELGIAERVDFRQGVPYDAMPALYRESSAIVLASLPRRGWEEQFGMVLAEALASCTGVVASRSGAIPEVVGDDAWLFEPGDWYELAQTLLAGPLSLPPGARSQPDPARIEGYSLTAAAARLGDAYESVLV